MFDNIVVVETTQAENGDSLWLTKEDLVDAVVVFGLTDYEPDHVGKYGPAPKAVVDLFVATGDHTGRLQSDTFFFGTMASQVSQIGVGNTAVGKVVTGKSKKGRDFFGVDFGVSASQAKKALALAQKASAKQEPNTDSEAPF